MSVALAMPISSKDSEVSEYGKRVANGYILSVVSQIRSVLYESEVFAQWEIDAITDSVVEVLHEDGELSIGALEKSLHSRSIPRDLAGPLAAALSN